MIDRLSPSQTIALSFAVVILLGALLLTLPATHTNGQWLNFRDALFTATSAVCVTGLVVVDTGTFYNILGQIIIMALIQIGGLGIVSVSVFFLISLRKNLPYSQRSLLSESFSLEGTGGVVRLLLRVFKITAFFEGIGFVILTFSWHDRLGWGKAAYFGLFHSISAFCNAGFDLFGGFRSLTADVGNIPVNLAITGLIILGGIGFPVIMDIQGMLAGRHKHLQVHTKIVVVTTVSLILLGAILFYVSESHGVLSGLTMKEKLLASYFQSVTPRTAGYNTVDMSNLQNDTILLLVFLMFIGASPISTGGGIKTSAFAMLILTTWTVVRGDGEIRVAGRSIDKNAVMKSIALMMLAGISVCTVSLLIQIVEPLSYERILFEVTSAFGTVGLTTGITVSLSGVSRYLLILLMYIGRIGPLTLMLAIAQKRKKSGIQLPEGRIIIG